MSKLRSKTLQNSKTTSRQKPKKPKKAVAAESSDDFLEEGAPSTSVEEHTPVPTLHPHDQSLYQAFQSNLLSLISHELRTPLTGVLNALAVLKDGVNLGGLSSEDLINMAHENAERLNQALLVLLDLASLEAKSFHLRLREIDLASLVRGRLTNYQTALKTRSVTLKWSDLAPKLREPLLGDPQKLGRAIDLCFQVVVPRAETQTEVKVEISSYQVRFVFQLAQNMEKHWQTAWSESGIGTQVGILSPYSAFAGVLQEEQAFLSRVEEGFGSEFLLIHEVLRLHHGKFTATLLGQEVTLLIEFPKMSSEEGLKAVLSSRTSRISMELGSVALILVQIPDRTSPEDLKEKTREALYRASDSVYLLPSLNQLAVVLDDCRIEDAARIMKRVERALDQKLFYSSVQSPSDGLDALELLKLGAQRLSETLK